jgi:hypothetical protein
VHRDPQRLGKILMFRKVNRHLTLMAGLDYFRNPPRRDDLDHYECTNPAVYGVGLQRRTSNR